MSKFKIVTIACLLSLGAVAAQAQSKAPGSGPNPYVDCGIGAALFPDTHWAAVSSNVIWDIGTTAVTSATMSPQTCSGKQVKTALFIRDSYEQVAEQTAQGQGEHLATALNLFECSAERQPVAVAAARANMAAVVSQPGFAAEPRLNKAAALYQVIEGAVAQSCGA